MEYLQSAEALIDLALEEDLGSGDITTDSVVSSRKQARAYFLSKSTGRIAGLKVAEIVFRKLDPHLKWYPKISEGSRVDAEATIVEFEGSYKALLSGERTALNFLQRMSGIATLTSEYVSAVESTKAKILDTRKTIPGFRALDKYAVKMGGGINHRMGLYDLVMIKDNHIKIAGGITNAVKAIKLKNKNQLKIEVETKTIREVEEAIKAKVDIIMLDNMSIDKMIEAVDLIDKRAAVEASGSINLDNVRQIAQTGVDFISIGALTHSVHAFDISQYIL
ncbi:MAG: carboxylating nicotinate-nucleotide diphosphorylase [Ignavibacteria bacterium]|jgi:nicotinate-nucleotide pyrophosphorylase (carboxylating)